MPDPTPKPGPLARWCAERSPPWTLQRLALELGLSREAVRQIERRGVVDRRTTLAMERLAQLVEQ